ncbi:hypothetical protein [Porphyrobacter sp. TH134]|uniref:hypothetical protein n=1 Tax=Porphyrobacter sp. TH134 TaxID=2067450 RepID=UPI001F466BF6|nr:hypothetical protein [Porphyrobacter sp. TH134]
MKKTWVAGALLALSATLAAPVLAKKDASFVVVNEEVGVPVFPYDITDRPYVVVKPVKAGVRKATIFSKEPSQEKIYKELWERAEKIDADAVVNTTYGDSHMTAFSWGKTNALGIAVRFLTVDEIASGKKGERAPTPSEFTEEMFK